MGKKSIYISIPCLGFDQQLANTVNSCLHNQSNDYQININIACIGNKDFYNMSRVIFNNFKNVNLDFFELEGNYGVGRGRNLAAKNYNNEDYFLQIDAHTLFDSNWDTQLVESFEKALIFSNNPKTILTSYVSNYIIDNGEICSQDFTMPFSYWDKTQPIFSFDIEKNTLFDMEIPRWEVCKVEKNQEIYNIAIKDGFIPSIKLCAQFVFGNKHFAKNRHIDDSVLFWEEEIVQSVELLDAGFTMLYPYTFSFLHHHFASHPTTESRVTFFQLTKDLGISSTDYLKEMKKRYKEYVFDPKNDIKIKKFLDYSKVDLKTNKVYSTTVLKDFTIEK